MSTSNPNHSRAKAQEQPDFARDTPIRELKERLLGLGYPWPDNLARKSRSWLEAETRLITPSPRDED